MLWWGLHLEESTSEIDADHGCCALREQPEEQAQAQLLHAGASVGGFGAAVTWLLRVLQLDDEMPSQPSVSQLLLLAAVCRCAAPPPLFVSPVRRPGRARLLLPNKGVEA